MGCWLNVTTDLAYFEMINACGLSRPVTSMEKLLGERTPGMGEVKGAFVAGFHLQRQIQAAEVGFGWERFRL